MTPPDDVLARAARAADWTEIVHLKSSYLWCFDGPDLDALMELFTDDAVSDLGPYGKWTGLDELRAGYESIITARDNHFPALHSVANPLIEVDGDEATGHWYQLVHMLNGTPDQPTLRLTALYHDRYRRVDGLWRIAHMQWQQLWSSDHGRVVGDPQMLDWDPSNGVAGSDPQR